LCAPAQPMWHAHGDVGRTVRCGLWGWMGTRSLILNSLLRRCSFLWDRAGWDVAGTLHGPRVVAKSLEIRLHPHTQAIAMHARAAAAILHRSTRSHRLA
jgi:hypothetical protein